VSLDRRRVSRSRSVAAMVSTALIDLQEVQGSGLKGYGRMAEDAKLIFDGSIRRMAALLEKMLPIVEAE
jgi:hypothetical protein